MKDLRLLVWLSQLGLSVALPPLAFIWLALWLRNHWGWGNWVVWAGIILGLICAADSFRITMKAMGQVRRDKQDRGNSVAFNDHE